MIYTWTLINILSCVALFVLRNDTSIITRKFIQFTQFRHEIDLILLCTVMIHLKIGYKIAELMVVLLLCVLIICLRRYPTYRKPFVYVISVGMLIFSIIGCVWDDDVLYITVHMIAVTNSVGCVYFLYQRFGHKYETHCTDMSSNDVDHLDDCDLSAKLLG